MFGLKKSHCGHYGTVLMDCHGFDRLTSVVHKIADVVVTAS